MLKTKKTDLFIIKNVPIHQRNYAAKGKIHDFKHKPSSIMSL